MSRIFSAYRPAIEQRRRHLHRVISHVGSTEIIKKFGAVDFTGYEYLDGSAWEKAIVRLLWTPGVYVWHRNDTVRCAGRTMKGCWSRVRSGFPHEHIRPDTVLPTDGFTFYSGNHRETVVLEIDLIHFFEPPFGRRRDGIDLYYHLLKQVGAWHPKPQQSARNGRRR